MTLPKQPLAMRVLLHWKPMALLIVLIALVDAQTTVDFIGLGNTVPIDGITDDVCVDKGLLVADNRSLCWYYQCSPSNAFGDQQLLPKRCPLGTYISPSFRTSMKTPCTRSFNITGSFDCTRSAREQERNCTSPPTCTSKQKLVQEDGVCWCECLLSASDCSSVANPVTGTVPRTPLPATCPPVDWCKGAMNGEEPCQNGGTCINQCTNFYCACPVPFTKTRYCEQFSCSNTNFKCSNSDQDCTRGLNGKDEFYVCRNRNCSDYLMQITI